jgi:hypothetical protein
MDRQKIYPSVCFTKEGMLVMWSTEGTKGSIAGPYDANIGGGKRAILALPAKLPPSRLHLLRQSRSSRTRIIDETPFHPPRRSAAGSARCDWLFRSTFRLQFQ